MADVTRRERRIQQRKEREEIVHSQRAQYKKREQTKRFINWGIALIVVFGIAYAIFVSLAPDAPGEYDDVARCLTQKGVTMYGTDWCPHCQEQKRAFGTSFRYINYINCDLNAAACELAGVEGYPTWVFPTGSPLSGEQEVAFLAERAECTLP